MPFESAHRGHEETVDVTKLRIDRTRSLLKHAHEAEQTRQTSRGLRVPHVALDALEDWEARAQDGLEAAHLDGGVEGSRGRGEEGWRGGGVEWWRGGYTCAHAHMHMRTCAHAHAHMHTSVGSPSGVPVPWASITERESTAANTRAAEIIRCWAIPFGAVRLALLPSERTAHELTTPPRQVSAAEVPTTIAPTPSPRT